MVDQNLSTEIDKKSNKPSQLSKAEIGRRVTDCQMQAIKPQLKQLDHIKEVDYR